MFKSLGNSLILRGLLALGLGVVAVAWPGVTVLVLVVMFAVYAFLSPACRPPWRSAAALPSRCSPTSSWDWSTWPPA
jgi:hypothetical protein